MQTFFLHLPKNVFLSPFRSVRSVCDILSMRYTYVENILCHYDSMRESSSYTIKLSCEEYVSVTDTIDTFSYISVHVDFKRKQ
jgi:hypothetical protein